MKIHRGILAAMTAIGLLAAGAAVAMVDEGKVLITIDRPGFTAPPPSKLGYYFPERSARLRVSGRALLDCGVSAEGKLTNCKAVATAPVGWEFNLAAERLAKAEPMQVKQPPPNGQVYLPLVFNAYDAPVPDKADLLVDQSIQLTPARMGKAPCPSATDPGQTCNARALPWAAKASLDQMAAILAAGAPAEGITQAHCRQDAAGGLTSCELRGVRNEQAVAALNRILAVYRPEAGKESGPGEILVTIDWARLPKVIAAFKD